MFGVVGRSMAYLLFWDMGGWVSYSIFKWRICIFSCYCSQRPCERYILETNTCPQGDRVASLSSSIVSETSRSYLR